MNTEIKFWGAKPGSIEGHRDVIAQPERAYNLAEGARVI